MSEWLTKLNQNFCEGSKTHLQGSWHGDLYITFAFLDEMIKSESKTKVSNRFMYMSVNHSMEGHTVP